MPLLYLCPGCGREQPKRGRCPSCRRPDERRRGTTAARGYGSRHQAERARWARIVNAGRADCARCGEPIVPGEAWDLGHTDDRSGYAGPEHAACNRSAPARRRPRGAP